MAQDYLVNSTWLILHSAAHLSCNLPTRGRERIELRAIIADTWKRKPDTAKSRNRLWSTLHVWCMQAAANAGPERECKNYWESYNDLVTNLTIDWRSFQQLIRISITTSNVSLRLVKRTKLQIHVISHIPTQWGKWDPTCSNHRTKAKKVQELVYKESALRSWQW
jgi:hypothetical protein